MTKLPKLEELELKAYRHQIIGDVKKLVEKYRAIFDWDVPDIDQDVADRLILAELHEAIDALGRESGSQMK